MKKLLLIFSIVLIKSVHGTHLHEDDAAFWQGILDALDGSSLVFPDETSSPTALPENQQDPHGITSITSSASDNDEPANALDETITGFPSGENSGTSKHPYIILQMHENELVGYLPNSSQRYDVFLPPGLTLVSTDLLPNMNSPNQRNGAVLSTPIAPPLSGIKRKREDEEKSDYKNAPFLESKSQQPTFDTMVYCIFLGAGATYTKQKDHQGKTPLEVTIDDPDTLNDCINHHARKKNPTNLGARVNTFRSYFEDWPWQRKNLEPFLVAFKLVNNPNRPGAERFRNQIMLHENAARLTQDAGQGQSKKKPRSS